MEDAARVPGCRLQLGYPLLQGYSSTSINWIAVEARVYLGFLSTTRNELLWARFSSLLWDKLKPPIWQPVSVVGPALVLSLHGQAVETHSRCRALRFAVCDIRASLCAVAVTASGAAQFAAHPAKDLSEVVVGVIETLRTHPKGIFFCPNVDSAASGRSTGSFTLRFWRFFAMWTSF
jgi:hypothetical protein